MYLFFSYGTFASDSFSFPFSFIFLIQYLYFLGPCAIFAFFFFWWHGIFWLNICLLFSRLCYLKVFPFILCFSNRILSFCFYSFWFNVSLLFFWSNYYHFLCVQTKFFRLTFNIYWQAEMLMSGNAIHTYCTKPLILIALLFSSK